MRQKSLCCEPSFGVVTYCATANGVFHSVPQRVVLAVNPAVDNSTNGLPTLPTLALLVGVRDVRGRCPTVEASPSNETVELRDRKLPRKTPTESVSFVVVQDFPRCFAFGVLAWHGPFGQAPTTLGVALLQGVCPAFPHLPAGTHPPHHLSPPRLSEIRCHPQRLDNGDLPKGLTHEVFFLPARSATRGEPPDELGSGSHHGGPALTNAGPPCISVSIVFSPM